MLGLRSSDKKNPDDHWNQPMNRLDTSHSIPAAWKIDWHNFGQLDSYLDEIITHGVTVLNYEPHSMAQSRLLDDLIREIQTRLSNSEGGIAILDLNTVIDRESELLTKTKLLIVMIGNRLGRTVTRNHLSKSPFLPVYNRKEGKGDNYIGNALTSNRPGIHTDGSAWRIARVDLLALLSVSSAFFGGETILVNALQVFDALPRELQAFLCSRSFIRQDPFDHRNPDPVRRTIFHQVRASFYTGLSIKYHRTRIEGGHDYLGEPLSVEDKDALDKLDRSLLAKRFRHQFKLRSGQILFVNNNFICHDRTRFVDFGNRKRYLERYWAGEPY